LFKPKSAFALCCGKETPFSNRSVLFYEKKIHLGYKTQEMRKTIGDTDITLVKKLQPIKPNIGLNRANNG
jgi:hypothetical protein